MDRRLQQLRRRAASGDAEAGLHLAYTECRAGQHILRLDQIILSPDVFQSEQDVGGCQCGMKMFDSVDLCKMGHHRLLRLYSTEPGTPLQYWCVRMAFRSVERALKWMRRQPAGTLSNPVAPSRGFGCSYHLTGIEACNQGLHFLDGPRENLQNHRIYRNCEVTQCNYRELAECPDRQHDLHWRPEEDTAICRRCTRSFEGHELCHQGQHFPDYVMQNCIREGCNLYQRGTSLHKALAESYRKTGRLEATCRIGNRTVAKASGWDRKLGKYGVKKPRLDPEERAKRSSKWWKFVNPRQYLTVFYTNRDPRINPDNPQIRYRLQHRANYTDIKSELKTRWNGYWYALPE